MDRNRVLLKKNIARIRREIRLAACEMQQLVDADLDCSGVAKVIAHMENDLRLYLDKLELLTVREQA
jgi:hypothetical protein